MTDDSAQGEGEFGFITRALRPLATDTAALQLRDDAALLAPTKGKELVISADMLVADVHFRSTDDLDSVARKAIAVNISDIAAKGAIPRGYFLQIAWPKNTNDEDRILFVSGLQHAQREYRISLLGGDTTSTAGPLVIAITMLGEVPAGQMIHRSGCRSGDDLWVTGTIGDAAMALKFSAPGLENRYLVPEPPAAFGSQLGEFATAALDISDGLAADASHIAEQSNVTIIIDASRIPLSSEVQKLVSDETLPIIISGGDDYQILFTAPAEHRETIEAVANATGTMVTRIGSVSDHGGGVRVLQNGQPLKLPIKGFTHF